MAYRRRRNSAALAMEALQLGFAAPQVVAHRLMRIASAGSQPSARDRRELWLMGAEKFAAFGESWYAMMLELARANVAFALSFGPYSWFRSPFAPISGRRTARHLERTAVATLVKGIAPVRRRAVANARRLSRKS